VAKIDGICSERSRHAVEDLTVRISAVKIVAILLLFLQRCLHRNTAAPYTPETSYE
jgi:hypothetical protein